MRVRSGNRQLQALQSVLAGNVDSLVCMGVLMGPAAGRNT